VKLIGNLIFLIGFFIITPSISFAEVIIDPWSQTSSIPIATGGVVALTNEKWLYIFGGSALNVIPNRLYSLQNDFGELSNWQNLSSNSEVSFYQTGAIKNKYFYLLGGQSWPTSISRNSVYKGIFENSGDINSWALEQNKLPKYLALGGSAIIGDWIYYAGGFTDLPSNQSNKVYKARINSDGSLGVWSQAGIMPDPLNTFGLAKSKNKLIFLGGIAPGNTVISTVRSAEVDNTTGNIVTWTNLQPLPGPTNCQAVAQTEKGVLVMGGWFNGNLNTVYYSKFDEDGNTGSWETSLNPLPWKICGATASIIGEYVYVIGGFADGEGIFDRTDAVWKAKLSPEVLSPTPVPTKVPVILIPGMGASYNPALLHIGTSAPNTEWKTAAYVKNYEGLIKSLKNSGYQEGKDLFSYDYDWRKPIGDNALSLDEFLLNKNLTDSAGTSKINIVGHSMGGLLGSKYSTLHPENVAHLISLGSPFGGSALAYKVWEGADFADFGGIEKIAISLLLNLNAGRFDSDVQTIQKNIPSFLNLLPTNQYLKKVNGNWIPAQTISWKNNFWPYLANDINKIASNSSNIYGTSINTEDIYTVKNRTIIDQVLGRWEDGKPIKTDYNSGDGTVSENAAKFNGASWINKDNISHGDLPSSVEVWKNISEILGINSSTTSVAYPEYERALVMAIASPATFEVTTPNGDNFNPTENLLVLDKPENGDYKIKIKPIGNGGKFTFYFGRITDNDQAWDDFSGTVATQEAELSYRLDWDKSDLGSNPTKRGIDRLEKIKEAMKTSNINEGEKQVFDLTVRNLGTEMLTINSLDENRQAAVLRTALQKINQAQKAWNQPDPEFTNLVVYNLRLFTRDVLEAIGN